jgi:hypothetical protein
VALGADVSDELMLVDALDEMDLRHYASKYYDPAKAKAYYERTKELKGRQAAKPQLSAESRAKQTAAKAVVRQEVSKQRTAAQKAAMKAQAARMEKLRKTAEETRDRILKKVEDLVAKLQADIAVEVPKPKLNEIPATASPRQRAFLEKQNARMMSEYNGKVRKATEKARNTANEAKDAARAEIKQVGEGLKAAVTKARDDYNKNRKALSEKYSSDLKTELKNIEDKVR